MKLATTYLGFKLRTPLVPSASPLSENLDNIKRMEDAGASAVVFHSLFEEQLRPGRYRMRRGFGNGGKSRNTVSQSAASKVWPAYSVGTQFVERNAVGLVGRRGAKRVGLPRQGL